MQAQRTLSHLDPERQYIVVLLDASHQFAHVLILSLLDVLVRQISEGEQLMYLVHHPIYIRCNSGHEEEASLLHQVLTLVLHQVLLVYILLLLQSTALVTKHNHGQAVLQCPRQIGNNHLEQGSFFFPDAGGHFHLPHTDYLAFRVLQQEFLFRWFRAFLLFTHRTDRHVRSTHQNHEFLLDGCQDGLGHILQLLCIRWHRGRDFPTDFQRLLQALHVAGVAHLPSAVQVGHQANEHHQSAQDQRQEQVQHVRFLFQCQVSALQLLVLTGIVQDIQINVSIIIRLRFHAQSRVGHTELLAESGYPFGHGLDALGIDPIQFNRLGSLRDVRLQPVQCIVAMIELFVMEIHVR